MIQKSENCLYCGEKMESKRVTKKFCSDNHKLYYWREHSSKKSKGTKNKVSDSSKVEVDMNLCPPELKGIDRTIWKNQQQELKDTGKG